jgi:hypothetical protein
MSSLRKQGPITTGLGRRESRRPAVPKERPRRMGPCFRRDDMAFLPQHLSMRVTRLVQPPILLFKQPRSVQPRLRDPAACPREFCRQRPLPLITEGAGNAGRWMRPQPRVQDETKHTSIVTTVTPETPGIPRAMVLTVSSALSPVIGLVCHRHRRDVKHRRQFDASVETSGPHDFAVRRSAHSSARHQRPPHPASRP